LADITLTKVADLAPYMKIAGALSGAPARSMGMGRGLGRVIPLC
jgi:hypothetical protein